MILHLMHPHAHFPNLPVEGNAASAVQVVSYEDLHAAGRDLGRDRVQERAAAQEFDDPLDIAFVDITLANDVFEAVVMQFRALG